MGGWIEPARPLPGPSLVPAPSSRSKQPFAQAASDLRSHSGLNRTYPAWAQTHDNSFAWATSNRAGSCRLFRTPNKNRRYSKPDNSLMFISSMSYGDPLEARLATGLLPRDVQHIRLNFAVSGFQSRQLIEFNAGWLAVDPGFV